MALCELSAAEDFDAFEFKEGGLVGEIPETDDLCFDFRSEYGVFSDGNKLCFSLILLFSFSFFLAESISFGKAGRLLGVLWPPADSLFCAFEETSLDPESDLFSLTGGFSLGSSSLFLEASMRSSSSNGGETDFFPKLKKKIKQLFLVLTHHIFQLLHNN